MENQMKLRWVFAANAVIAGLTGVLSILLPGLMYAIYGLTSTASAQLVGQFLGTGLVGEAIITWGLRNTAPGPVRNTLTLALFVASVLGCAVAFIAQVNGVLGPLGWATVAVNGLFAVAYAYYRFVRPEAP
jgi:hypothetical protein